MRLLNAARYYSVGLSVDPGDLVGEAYLKAISGDRKCPAHVEVRTFLRRAIQSLAHGARQTSRRARLVSLADDSIRFDAEPVIDSTADDRIERQIAEDQQRRVQALFMDDDDAYPVVQLMFKGYRGNDICRRAGLTPHQLATVRRRIRRRIARAREEGQI